MEEPKTAHNKINILLVLALFLSFVLACNSGSNAVADRTALDGRQQIETKIEDATKPKLLDTYTVRGFRFSYYLVAKDMSNEDLIATAQELHRQETDAQLILVDEESGIADYVNYAKETSKGNNDVNFPKQWAAEHIVGNVQRYLSGKWMLCEGNGYKEIAELK